MIYSPIIFDFIKMKLQFKKDGNMIKLKWIMEEARVQVVARAHKSLKESLYGFAGQFFHKSFSSTKKRSIKFKSKDIVRRVAIYVYRTKTSSIFQEFRSQDTLDTKS
jgi:hypothetical protein